jgi:hypothetical protein
MSSAYANTLWDTVGLLAVNNHSKTRMLFIYLVLSRTVWCYVS